MSEAPELIYLQWIPKEAWDNYEDVITWCQDQINDDDIEYVKASTATRLRELLKRVKERADMAGDCLFCEMAWCDGYHHTNDCEVMEELGDD